MHCAWSGCTTGGIQLSNMMLVTQMALPGRGAKHLFPNTFFFKAEKDTQSEDFVRLQESHASQKLELVILSLDEGPNAVHSCSCLAQCFNP